MWPGEHPDDLRFKALKRPCCNGHAVARLGLIVHFMKFILVKIGPQFLDGVIVNYGRKKAETDNGGNSRRGFDKLDCIGWIEAREEIPGKQRFNEPPAVVEAEIIVAVGAVDLGVPENIVRAGRPADVIRPSSRARWLDLDGARAELNI